jgi:hypothetical protein
MPIAEPWHSFFSELDPLLSGPTQLHCIGGFALTVSYGLARQTADVDVVTVSPAGHRPDLQTLAGEGSNLHRKHRVYIQQVGVANLPFDFESRLRQIAVGPLNNLSLYCPEPHDLALSKLERNSTRDREDILFLASQKLIQPKILLERFHEEHRPYLHGPLIRHDNTISLWLEMCWPEQDSF